MEPEVRVMVFPFRSNVNVFEALMVVLVIDVEVLTSIVPLSGTAVIASVSDA